MTPSGPTTHATIPPSRVASSGSAANTATSVGSERERPPLRYRCLRPPKRMPRRVVELHWRILA